MDSDDVVVHPELLKDFALRAKKNNIDCIFFRYVYGALFDGKPSLDTFISPEVEQIRERIMRRGAIVWKKRIHETPIPLDPPNYKYTQVKYSDENPMFWLHLGADRFLPKEEMDRRMARNRNLLEMELAEEREVGEADARTLLYLMKILVESDDEKDQKDCVSLGNEYLEKSGWDEERALACSMMARSMGNCGNLNSARDFLLSAIKEYPYSPLLYLYLAKTYFDLRNFRAMKHWLSIGLSIDNETSTMQNLLEMKVLASELTFNYYYFGVRDIRKALPMMEKLYSLVPTQENKKNLEIVTKQNDLDIASEHTHKLMKYLVEQDNEWAIVPLLDTLPQSIKTLPFAVKYYIRYSQPKRWASNEICYFANFGGKHFEKWDGNSLSVGIGGSETAVIRLSEEWTKKGFKVTVYGDPENEIEVNGVVYKPWYMFNPRDKFNIFIQWRNSNLARKVNSKIYLVDLHDVFDSITHERNVDQIDRIMVKSNFHKSFGKEIADEKFAVISNGIS